MRLQDVQKKENSAKIVVSGRVNLEDKKFIEENKVNVGLLIREAIKEIKGKGENHV